MYMALASCVARTAAGVRPVGATKLGALAAGALALALVSRTTGAVLPSRGAVS
ncbi:MAG: hypothetical protein JWN04_6172 [Myxococcaceae bacterium]|nr:hypothetical protein [Myxococcaceae bacterium]